MELTCFPPENLKMTRMRFFFFLFLNRLRKNKREMINAKFVRTIRSWWNMWKWATGSCAGSPGCPLTAAAALHPPRFLLLDQSPLTIRGIDRGGYLPTCVCSLLELPCCESPALTASGRRPQKTSQIRNKDTERPVNSSSISLSVCVCVIAKQSLLSDLSSLSTFKRSEASECFPRTFTPKNFLFRDFLILFHF